MRRLVKYLFQLLILAGIGFVGYAMFADLPAPTRDTVLTLPVPRADR
ncbi:MAG TPA: hypothetical protein VMY41_10180 [Thermohalobaculum sp.]|nr:hypothetical protein [Thermohalobaculum sp.]